MEGLQPNGMGYKEMEEDMDKVKDPKMCCFQKNSFSRKSGD